MVLLGWSYTCISACVCVLICEHACVAHKGLPVSVCASLSVSYLFNPSFLSWQSTVELCCAV